MGVNPKIEKPSISDSMLGLSIDVVVFPEMMVPPNHPLKNRVWNHYFHHPFWGTIIFGNTHIYVGKVYNVLYLSEGPLINKVKPLKVGRQPVVEFSYELCYGTGYTKVLLVCAHFIFHCIFPTWWIRPSECSHWPINQETCGELDRWKH